MAAGDHSTPRHRLRAQRHRTVEAVDVRTGGARPPAVEPGPRGCGAGTGRAWCPRRCARGRLTT
ncbi:MAG: hypothetical protein ACRDRQ_21035, partial [Pseudonocardiaceae bacterium]